MKEGRSSGFTFIELLIVIILIGFIMAMAVLAITSWMPGYYLKSAARDIKSQILQCKMRAVKDNCSCEMHFAPAGQKYKIVNAAGCTNTYSQEIDLAQEYRGYPKFGDSGYGKACEEASGSPSVGTTFPTFAGEGGYQFRVVFQSNGRPSLAQTGGVYLRNEKGQAYAICVNPAGGVRMYQWDKKWELR